VPSLQSTHVPERGSQICGSVHVTPAQGSGGPESGMPPSRVARTHAPVGAHVSRGPQSESSEQLV
jgi:hypothetical protein